MGARVSTRTESEGGWVYPLAKRGGQIRIGRVTHAYCSREELERVPLSFCSLL